MICILKRDKDNEITGWIIAIDLHDAWQQAEAAGEHSLIEVLYRMAEAGKTPSPGKHKIFLGEEHHYTMLVS